MEPLDRTIAEALNEGNHQLVIANKAARARILIVGCDLKRCANFIELLTRRGHNCATVNGRAEAQAVMARGRFDVIVLNNTLPDGDGLELSPVAQKDSPSTKIIMVSETAAVADTIRAMRCGAVDFIHLPVSAEEFANRVDAALLKSRADRQRDERIVRLKKICRELNTARHEVSKQVDSLCNDLVNAYEEIADQMNDVAMASEFRTLLKQELDVEDLLRTTLEYMLTKTGPTNAAVFLPDARGSMRRFGLGAYVNYDCPRETISVLLDHLGNAICPQMADEPEIVSFDDAKEFSEWIGLEAGFLADSQVVAFSCRHKCECLALIVLFRNKANPFNENLAGVIDTLREIIAEQLANVVRVHHRAQPSWPGEAKDGDLDYHDDDLGFGGHEGGLAA